MIEIKNWKITKSWFGQRIKFKCPSCKIGLVAKLREAGSADHCPYCGIQFRVPGKSFLSGSDKIKRGKTKLEFRVKDVAQQNVDKAEVKPREMLRVKKLCYDLSTKTELEQAIPVAETISDDTEEVFSRFRQKISEEAQVQSFSSWKSASDSQFDFDSLPDTPELKSHEEEKRWKSCKAKARTWFNNFCNGDLRIAPELAEQKKLSFWLFDKNAPRGWRHCNFFHNDWETIRFTTRFVPQDFHYHFANLMELDTNPANFFFSCYEKPWAPLGRVWWRKNTQYADPIKGVSIEFDNDIERLYELMTDAQLNIDEAHRIKLRADTSKQQLVENAIGFDWTSTKCKPPSEVKSGSDYRIEITLDLDNFTVTIDGKTIDLNTYIDSYSEYETWVSPDFKNKFRKAATKYHPDLGKDERDRDRRKSIMAKLNSFYENKDEDGLQEFLNDIARD